MKKQEKLKYFKSKLEQEIEEALYFDDLCYKDYNVTDDKAHFNYIEDIPTLFKKELQKY